MATNSFRKSDWIAALAISVAAAWLHFTFLAHAGGLWRDEVNLVNLAGLSSVSGMAKDSFPLLMPLVVRGWLAIGLGKADAQVRWLGMLIGLGLLGSLWVAAWITIRAPPLLGLALLCLNPTALTYGDSLRAYGLGSLLIVLAFAAMWHFLRQPTLLRGILFGGLAVLSVQTLFHNAVLVAAICIGAWAVCARRKAGRTAAVVLGAGVIAAVSLLPYLPNLVSARESAAALRTGLHPLTALPSLIGVVSFPLQSYVYVWALLVILTIASGCVSLRRSSPAPGSPDEGGDLRWFAGTTLLAGAAGFAGFLGFVALDPQPWYFLPLLAFVAVCFDCGIPRPTAIVRAVVAGCALGTALIAFPVARVNVSCRFTNVDILARWLNVEASPGDLVVVTPWFCGISFERYYQGPAPWATLPPLEDHRFHRFDMVAGALEKRDAIRPVLDRMAATLQAGHCVWLLGEFEMARSDAPPPPDLPPPPLEGWGWSQTPYVLNWTARAAIMLGNQSRQFDQVKGLDPGEVSPYEHLRLAKATGWKSSASPTDL